MMYRLPPTKPPRPYTWTKLLAPERVLLAFSHLLLLVATSTVAVVGAKIGAGYCSVPGAAVVGMALLWLVERARERP